MASRVGMEFDLSGRVALGGQVDAQGRRRVTMSPAYSGAEFESPYGRAIIDVSGVQLPERGVPLYRQHDPALYVGRADDVSLGDGRISLTGYLFSGDPDSDRIANLSDLGADWQASVRVVLLEESFLQPDQTAEINGRDVEGPLIIMRQSRLVEASFVPVGADTSTMAVALEVPPITHPEEGAMLVNKDALASERERVAAIGAAYTADSEFALRAITEGWSVLEARAHRADALEARLAEQDSVREAQAARIEELEAQIAAPQTSNPPVAPAAPAAPAAALIALRSGAPQAGFSAQTDPITAWTEALDAEVDRLERRGSRGSNRGGSLRMSRRANVRQLAVSRVALADPDLHSRYLAAHNGRGA